MSNDDMDATETFGGTCITIATLGNYTLDTRDASAAGDAMLRLKPGASLKIDIGETTALRIEDVGGWLRIELGGDADQRLVLGDKLVERLNAFFEAAFDLHVHATPMGPSGPPLPAFIGGRLGDEVLSDVAFTKKS